MNDFEYEVAYQKIASAKLVYQLEDLVRNYAISYTTIFHTNGYKQIISVINQYKALTFALQCFNAKSRKSLPDFIYDSVRDLEEHITELIINQPITYDQFIDCFQFKSGVIKCKELYSNGYSILKAFALIVKDKPQPYSFNWSYYSNPIYRELISGETSKIITLEHFKQQNQLVNNTIVEQELAKLYSDIQPDSVLVADAHNFVKQIDSVYDTIKSKLI